VGIEQGGAPSITELADGEQGWYGQLGHNVDFVCRQGEGQDLEVPCVGRLHLATIRDMDRDGVSGTLFVVDWCGKAAEVIGTTGVANTLSTFSRPASNSRRVSMPTCFVMPHRLVGSLQ